MILRDLCHTDFLIMHPSDLLKDGVARLMGDTPSYVLSVLDGQVRGVFSSQYLMKYYMQNPHSLCSLEDTPSDKPFVLMPSGASLDALSRTECGTYIIAMEQEMPIGVLHYDSRIKNMNQHSPNPIMDMPFEGFQQVFENIEEEIIVSSKEGKVCYLNKKAEALMGLSSKEIVGRTLGELVEKRIFYPSAALEVLKTGKKVNLQTHMQTGEERLSTAIPIFNARGEVDYAVCTSKNVAEILQLNQQLAAEQRKLEQKHYEIERMQKREFEQMNFYFDSKEMFKVMHAIKRASPLDMTVLILGETGVGKEIVAKSIHYLSNRRTQPFVKINCGLIPENLIEAELFGYEEGSFTGASKGGKKGKVEMAHGGTLFLDEIGDMPFHLQIKLLDFLQDNSYVRVGGTKRHHADVRIISATNQNLNEMVEKGTFRMDLFYRLNVFSIQIPPLRERTEDIPALTEYFLKKFNGKYNLQCQLSPDVIKEMYQYRWPGNVRELEHTLERMIVMSESEIVSSDILHEAINERQKPALSIVCNGILPYKEAKGILEKILIQRAYELYGSTYKAAEALGIDQSTVSKLLKKYRDD